MTNDKEPDKINYYIYILKYICIYNIYSKYNQYIDIKLLRDRYRELSLIYEVLYDLLEKHKRDITLDELQLTFLGSYPNLKQEQFRAYEKIFSAAKETEVKQDVVEESLETLRRRNLASKISDQAYLVSEGKGEWDKFLETVEKLGNEQPVATPIEFVTDDLDTLLNDVIDKPGLRWRLDSLNKSLGSLRKGDFGFIVARPETGKTTFLASEATFMAPQAQGPILWFNNEEQGSKVKVRCFEAALGATIAQIQANRKRAVEAYGELTKHNIKLFDQAEIGRREVENICLQMQPSLIIFDQLDKIKGFDADRNDLVLGKIYQWARELAKRYAPVIGVCQADGTADGVAWLTMHHVADAKTAKQAEADWILGIGKTYRDGYEMIRHLNLSKNKLMGDPDTLPELRHGKRDVLIQPEIGRYKDL